MCLFFIHCENSQYETKWSRQAARMILCFCHFLKKRKRKYWVHPILQTREEQGEFHLLKELRNYPDHFQVYFKMSVVQFDMLLAILEPHIKRRSPNFCKSIDPEQQLACVWGRTLSLSLSLFVKQPFKDLDGWEKTQKMEPVPKKIMMNKSFGVSV